MNQVIEECGSTNDLARALAEAGHPEGTWISARRQTAGRGRQGREWRSAEGGLFLSWIARPEPELFRERGTWLSLACATAVADALERGLSAKGIQVKWPNDLKVASAKLAGMLSEAGGGSSRPFVVVGIGMNCESFPDGLDQEATSLSALLSRRVTADEARPLVLEGLGRALELLRSPDGLRQLTRLYEGRAAIRSRDLIEWQPAGSAVRRGRVLGLGPHGELKVRVASEDFTIETQSIFADDVTQVRQA
jgi:BirA family biotin operon repressor/biotin-[acetyl-CoA-carboxylase] ligase